MIVFTSVEGATLMPSGAADMAALLVSGLVFSKRVMQTVAA